MINLKKLSTTLILLLMAICAYAGGIKSGADLAAFASAINKGEDISAWRNEEGVVCFEGDIDMAKVKKFPTIKSFGGTIDGKGYAIKNWRAQNALIHELLEGGKIQNLRIDASCVMKAQNKGGEYFLGWIVNINNGTLQNCENHAPLNHKSNYTENDLYIGGLVGSNRYVVIDCRNYGRIASECVASAEKDIYLRMGGIIGGGYGKVLPCATNIRCYNYGEVVYEGDMPNDRIGGIIGDAHKTTTKMCVNRGNITSKSNLNINGKSGRSWVSGIATYGRRDIICCDNFGDITSTGANEAYAGGIAAMPHSKLVIADCTNYGKVEATNDRPAFVGGVVGNIGREVHIVNGINRGVVRFAGMSPDKASCVGGVVGNIYATKKATFGAYLRRCCNFGKVESQSGGNNYENSDKAIHTGGVVGRSLGTGAAPIRVLDCSNKGEVKAITGRRGNIAGYVAMTKVSGGWFDNNMAEPAEPMADGSTIFGRVTNTAGEPIAGVVVSDGVSCVATDGFGYYALKSDMAKSRFVFISVPDGYNFYARKSVPQIFRRIPRYTKAVTANFTLEKRTSSSENYTVVMIGDPQMRGLGHDGSGERFRDVVMPDIDQFKSTREGEFFAINLGDLVYNWMAGYDDYMDICASAQYPMFNVIGNHDYDQETLFETKLGTPFYEEYVSPTYYSFNIGKTHYILVNDIVYSRAKATDRYSAGLEEEQMRWLEEDLKFVPKDHTIVICGHAQLFHRHGTSAYSYGKKHLNYERYSNLLSQYKRVYSWSGHYHDNFGFDYAGKKGFENLANVTSITVARCNGQLRSNKELNTDGTTNGYMVVEVTGDKFEWYYKTVGKGRDYQMRAYSPLRSEDGYVKATIWNHSADYWSNPEWWENGVKVADMEHAPDFDPDYLEIYKTLEHLKGRAGNYAKPSKSRFMFRVKPSEGVRSGEVRVTDNFGVTYTQKVEW